MLNNFPVSPTLPVVDLERARKFYKDVLGLTETRADEMGGVYFECGNGTRLYIYQRSTPTKADHTACSFQVDDLGAEMVDLRSKGVVFEEYDMPGLKTVDGAVEAEDMKVAWFKDPEGNIIAIGQQK